MPNKDKIQKVIRDQKDETEQALIASDILNNTACLSKITEEAFPVPRKARKRCFKARKKDKKIYGYVNPRKTLANEARVKARRVIKCTIFKEAKNVVVFNASIPANPLSREREEKHELSPDSITAMAEWSSEEIVDHLLDSDDARQVWSGTSYLFDKINHE